MTANNAGVKTVNKAKHNSIPRMCFFALCDLSQTVVSDVMYEIHMAF